MKKSVEQRLSKVSDEREWLTDDEVDILAKEMIRVEAPRIRCRRCGYGKKEGQWTPDPRKWRDNKPTTFQYKGKEVRLMVCPACSAKNYASADRIADILIWWGCFGKTIREFKEEHRALRAKATAQ